MKRIYGFYRPERIETKNLWGNTSLHWTYTMWFYVNWQYADYIKAGIIKINDKEIPENRYTKEVVPWIKDLRRFVYLEYNDTIIDNATITKIANKIWARFDTEYLTINTAIDFIRKHTDLEEDSNTPWKFLIAPATKDIDWKTIPAKYLTIN